MKICANSDTPLLELLSKLAPDSSKTTLRSWVRENRIAIDGKPVSRVDILVKQGQEVELLKKHSYTTGGLRILFEDRALVVIDKPEGLLTVATDYQKSETAHAFLKARYGSNNIHVVHRIDRETSGVMLFARSTESRDRLKDLFEAHELEREYRAVVEGCMSDKEGTWESYLLEGTDYTVRRSSPNKGRKAITHYRVLGQKSNYTYLQLTLETGRKHQIRVHCKDAGHPVVGDKRYGASGSPIKRLGLHAHRIALTHPFTGKYLEFTSPVPPSFERVARSKKKF